MYEIKKLHRPIEITGIFAGIDDIHKEQFYFPGEFHDFWEAVLVKSGEMIATGDGRIYRLKNGNLLFHKPMEFHTVRVDRVETRLQIISFSARGEGMKQFESKCVELEDNEIEMFGLITKKFNSAASYYTDGNFKCFEKEGSFGAVMLESLLLSLIDRSSAHQKTVTSSERQYLDIIRVMKKNLDKMLSLEELAALCNMSASNLKKIFRGLSDVGASKFFLRMKLRRAMEMLDNGTSVKEAGLSIGFTDMNYFSTVFKRETGITPSEYRRAETNS